METPRIALPTEIPIQTKLNNHQAAFLNELLIDSLSCIK